MAILFREKGIRCFQGYQLLAYMHRADEGGKSRTIRPWLSNQYVCGMLGGDRNKGKDELI